MDNELRNDIRKIVNLTSSDLFWTKAPGRSLLRAAFESQFRRHRIQEQMKAISDRADITVDTRLDQALRNVADYVEEYGKGIDQTLAQDLRSLALQYQRIERSAEEENAGMFQRVHIYRRISLKDDPSFSDLRRSLKP